MKQHSTANISKGSDGQRYTADRVAKNVSRAKLRKIENFLEEHGYIFCEDCLRNDCVPIDCSHNISVAEAKKTGRVELAWDVENIKMRGRPCHKKHDKL